ncbi:hypothetical protein T492DRAFT_374582 [Pavlovales sp. CCMP2436]|nr:hypothetical protein T492DRAFT_374582 [Pavlovales sp. CCMP2436]
MRAPGGYPIELARAATWPSGAARRVVEVTPPGDTAAWTDALASPRLVAALDTLLGPGSWELPANGPAPPGGGRVPVRHWYAPVAFPEEPPGSGPASAPDVAVWTPVNRRGQHWRGWHVDIGPGFETDQMRTLNGHPYQGCVVLLLGSTVSPGGGGTALIRGSHRWVHAVLSAAGEEGVTHQQLNTWAAREAEARRHAGLLRLPYEVVSAQSPLPLPADPALASVTTAAMAARSSSAAKPGVGAATGTNAVAGTMSEAQAFFLTAFL